MERDKEFVAGKIRLMNIPGVIKVRTYKLVNIVKVDCERNKAEEVAQAIRNTLGLYAYTEDNTWGWGKVVVDVDETKFTNIIRQEDQCQI